MLLLIIIYAFSRHLKSPNMANFSEKRILHNKYTDDIFIVEYEAAAIQSNPEGF